MINLILIAASLGLVAPVFAQDSCNGVYTDQASCDANTTCTWCKCAAVPSACFEKVNAKKLPPGVYQCDSTELSATSSFPVSKTVEISAGVFMPTINLGGVESRPSNYSLFLEIGGVGLDTALTYGDDVQSVVGRAVRESGLKRKDIFVTTKIPCCPLKGATHCNSTHDPTSDIAKDLQVLGLDYVDLMLVHWPCNTPEETAAHYISLGPMLKAGTARAIGVSNFVSKDFEDLKQNTAGKGIPVPAINQCKMSIGDHDDATIK